LLVLGLAKLKLLVLGLAKLKLLVLGLAKLLLVLQLGPVLAKLLLVLQLEPVLAKLLLVLQLGPVLATPHSTSLRIAPCLHMGGYHPEGCIGVGTLGGLRSSEE